MLTASVCARNGNPQMQKYRTDNFRSHFGFNRMVDNSKKLMHKHEINALARIFGPAIVVAGAHLCLLAYVLHFVRATIPGTHSRKTNVNRRK